MKVPRVEAAEGEVEDHGSAVEALEEQGQALEGVAGLHAEAMQRQALRLELAPAELAEVARRICDGATRGPVKESAVDSS